MSTSSGFEVGKAVLKLLGLDDRKNVTKIVLTAEVDHVPVVELTEIVLNYDAIDSVRQQFQVVPMNDRGSVIVDACAATSSEVPADLWDFFDPLRRRLLQDPNDPTDGSPPPTGIFRTQCADCNGLGAYRGLNATEKCQSCAGTGWRDA